MWLILFLFTILLLFPFYAAALRGQECWTLWFYALCCFHRVAAVCSDSNPHTGATVVQISPAAHQGRDSLPEEEVFEEEQKEESEWPVREAGSSPRCQQGAAWSRNNVRGSTCSSPSGPLEEPTVSTACGGRLLPWNHVSMTVLSLHTWTVHTASAVRGLDPVPITLLHPTWPDLMSQQGCVVGLLHYCIVVVAV